MCDCGVWSVCGAGGEDASIGKRFRSQRGKGFEDIYTVIMTSMSPPDVTLRAPASHLIE